MIQSSLSRSVNEHQRLWMKLFESHCNWNLEAWQRDARRQHNDQAKPAGSRIVTSVGANASNVIDNDVLNVCDTRGATRGVDNVAIALAELTKNLENFMRQGPNQPAKDARGNSVPKTRKGMGPNPVVCWQCGQIGHVRKDCPQPRPDAAATKVPQLTTETCNVATARIFKGLDRDPLYLPMQLGG